MIELMINIDFMLLIQVLDYLISDLDVIFKPFHRLNKINNKIEGTGIGLAVAKQLVELMDGKIYVDSEKGYWKSLLCRIPSCRFSYFTSILKSQIQLKSKILFLKNKLYKVLYVEDNPANLRLVERILMQINNIEMLSATSGELSIDLAICS